MHLLEQDIFPRIWVPSVEQRDVRALLMHRHQWVRICMQFRMHCNRSHWVTVCDADRGCGAGSGRFSLLALSLAEHTMHARNELMALYRQLDADIETLDRMVANIAGGATVTRMLMTHPGVGPNTALATEVYREIRRGSPMAKP